MATGPEWAAQWLTRYENGEVELTPQDLGQLIENAVCSEREIILAGLLDLQRECRNQEEVNLVQVAISRVKDRR